MKIGIMGAMTEEVDLILKKLMTDVSTLKYGSRTYHCGKIDKHEVILVFSRYGKVAAATAATTLITKFKIDQLIFTGVAGAVSKDLNVGDIVISDKLYQHDMNAYPLFPEHEIPLTGITFFSADSALIKKAKLSATKVLSKTKDKASIETFEKLGISFPNKCVVGTIASGDKFISSVDQTKDIINKKPKTVAVEMEGAAVAQTCYDHKVPFVVIRAISDRADHKAHIDFQAFIEKIASHYSKNIVQNMLSY